MSTTEAKASTLSESRPSRLRAWMLPAAFIGLGVLIASTFGYFQATIVNGSEFDNNSWTVRSFWYRRDPFTGAQMTGILRDPPASLTSKTNFPNSYFVGTNNVAARWDLIELKCGTAVTEGPANVLYSYFEPYGSDRFWEDWSSNNLPKANILWTAARDLVDLELYHQLPQIMPLAKVESTDEEFKSMIYNQMQSILATHCDELKIAEKTDELSFAETLSQKYTNP